MATNKPNSRRNLDIAINRLSTSQTKRLQIRTIMANTIVGQLLPTGAVKGGSALKLRYGNEVTRFTRDLDVARKDDLDIYISEFDSALKAGWSGFTGRIVTRQPASPEGVPNAYIMQPFDIKLSYNSKPWVTVPFEIGHDEIGDTVNPDYAISPDIVEVFRELGFPTPSPIALMPIHHQIAQKLHGLSEAESERAHDLIDLQLMIRNESIDYRLVKDTCERLFISRKKQAWPPVIVEHEGWDSIYTAQARGLDVLEGVNQAVAWCNDLIAGIALAATFARKARKRIEELPTIH